jgi:integrase
MSCIHCSRELPPGAAFCAFCGKKQVKKAKTTKRANGEGSVRKLQDGSWLAEVVLWYYWDPEKNRMKPKTISKSGFKKKADASAYVPALREDGYKKWGKAPPGSRKGKPAKRPETFEEVYEAWLPTHTAGKGTMAGYKSVYKHFSPVHKQKMDDIYIDDLQECIDECPRGKRTRETMKSLCGLIYKYAVPRQYVSRDLILSQFIVINIKATESRRTGFMTDELEKIRQAIGKVPYADYIYCMCYLGFRPSEFVDLRIENYNKAEKYFIGGAKTEAGKDRIVPVSDKIQQYVDTLIESKTSLYVFCDQSTGERFNLRKFREDYFAPALDAIGINETEREARLLTPHCCRHTFANLLKNALGADKDKLSLIGHASDGMLREYQDADLESLRKVINTL